MAAGYFSLLVQREVTKRKTPSRPRSLGHPCPSDYASRLRGSPGAHPCALVERARIVRAPLRAISYACSPPPRGAREKQGAAVPAAEAVRTVTAGTTHPLSRSRERARVRAAFGSPLSSGEGRTETAACTARGRREGSRRFGCRPWMACQPNPFARSEPLAPRAARIRGCRFLWLLSFGQAKESNRPPWMADETHTDVSRSSRWRGRPNERKGKIKMDFGLRRNDEDEWIPAFAGMTKTSGFRPTRE